MAARRILDHPVLHLMTGSTMSQILTLAFMPIVSRLYDPSTIGLASIFMNFAIMCLSIQPFQYDQALYTTRDNREISPLKRLVVFLILVNSLILTGVFTLLCHYGVLGFRDLNLNYAFALPPLLIAAGLAKLGRVLTVKEGDFKRISKVTAICSAISNSSKAGFGAINNSVASYLASEILLHFGTFTGYYKILRAKISGETPDIGARNVARKYSEYATYGQLSVVLDTIAVTIPIQYVTTLYGPAVAGIFALSYRIASIGNSNIGAAITDVFISRFSEMYRNQNFYEARHLFKKTVQKSLILAIPIGIGLMLVPPFIFGHVFGQKWHDGGAYCAILTPWVLSIFIVSPLSNALVVLRRQKLKLIYDISALLGSGIVFFIAQKYAYETKSFLLLLTISQVASYIIYYLIIHYAVKRMG